MNTNYDKVDCLVIGAGVVGLAIARKFAMSSLQTYVLEREKSIGQGISSRNSEVIHAGIYYAKNSLKAALCTQGKQLLYEYANSKNIAHKNCGKIIVATNKAQIDELENIRNKAFQNGVHDLDYLTQQEVKNLEPDINCLSALFSPSTGIIDTHEFMLAMLGDLENLGGQCAYISNVRHWEPYNDGILVQIDNQGETFSIFTSHLINCAGLDAVNLASSFEGFPKHHLPELKYAKGNYLSLTGKHNFKHLIYPVPEKAGLGIHLTLDIQGKARFGPDVEWVNTLDYKVTDDKAAKFYNAIRQYWPNLGDGRLIPDYAGIRPKIYFDDVPYTDFLIQDKTAHGISGLINLMGIESPGLTASMAIAEKIYSSLS